MLALLHNAPCDLPCIRLFTVVTQNAGQLFPRKRRHQIRRRLAALAHAHIQRCIHVIRKPAVAIVQLVAGNPQIQQRAVDLLDSQLCQGLLGLAKVHLHHLRRQALQAFGGGLYSIGVLIE